MKIDKVKKLKRQEKIFSVLLGIFSIVLGLILILFLFGSIATPLLLYAGFGTIIITALASIYILPVLGVIGVIIIIMYIVKMLLYKEKKAEMVFRTIISTALLIAMLIGSFITFIKYGLSNTYEIKVESTVAEISDSIIKDNVISILENTKLADFDEIYVKKIILITNLGFRETIYYRDANGLSHNYSSNIDDTVYGEIVDKFTEITWLTQLSYILFLILSIVSLVLWYNNISKQYKLMIQKAINEKFEEQKQERQEEKVTEAEIIKSNRKRIFITTIIIITCIVVFILSFAVTKAIKENRQKRQEEERLNDFKESSSYENLEEEQGEEYKYFSDDENGILIEMKAPFRDRYVVQIYKTTDGGESWNQIKTNIAGVYVGTKFMFINDKVGFCHDPHGGVDSYASLKITTDGGYTWNNVIVNKPDSITENNIFFKDLPQIENDKLTVVAYTVRLNRYPNEKYYQFESKDFGETWDFVKELEDIE